GSIWGWALRRGEVDEARNPARGLERYREQGRERYLTSSELAHLGDALQKLGPFPAAAIRLLLFTGARLREILNAKWEWLDTERGLLFLPDSKTGKKTILLGAPAMAVLASLPRIKGNPHIIPGEKPGQPLADLNRPWAAVTKAAGLEGVRIHDLRHSFASFGAGASPGRRVRPRTSRLATWEEKERGANLRRMIHRAQPKLNGTRRPGATRIRQQHASGAL